MSADEAVQMYWREPGDLSGQECTEHTDAFPYSCGGNMRIVSIDNDPKFEWVKRQDRVSTDMQLDLILKCTSCGDVFEGALYHDDLWEVEE